MAAHLLIALLDKVATPKKILEFKDTKVIALDRDIKSKKLADEIMEKFQGRFYFKNKI